MYLNTYCQHFNNFETNNATLIVSSSGILHSIFRHTILYFNFQLTHEFLLTMGVKKNFSKESQQVRELGACKIPREVHQFRENKLPRQRVTFLRCTADFVAVSSEMFVENNIEGQRSLLQMTAYAELFPVPIPLRFNRVRVLFHVLFTIVTHICTVSVSTRVITQCVYSKKDRCFIFLQFRLFYLVKLLDNWE